MTTTPFSNPIGAHGEGAPSVARGLRFQSSRAAAGALVLLLALPITIAFDRLVPGYSEIVIHVLLAMGTLLVGLSAFDFATAHWVSRVACGAACALAAIFFLQAQAALPHNEALRSFAYSTELGGWAEALTVSTLMGWLITVARTYGRGPTMLFGALSALIVICLSVWGMFAAPGGGTPAELRLLFLLPVGWLLVVGSTAGAGKSGGDRPGGFWPWRLV